MTGTDPAIEAALRALDISALNHRGHLVNAAREALKPIRELHVKTKNAGHCQNGDCPCFEPEWVCSCGKLIDRCHMSRHKRSSKCDRRTTDA